MQTSGTADTAALLYADFVALWQGAPMPSKKVMTDWNRQERAEATAVALAWGWLVRVSRTGEAALRLEAAGYSEEAAPLIRSMLEHAIRLRWAQAAGAEFVEVALRMRSKSLEKIIEAQRGGWQHSPELVEKMEAAMQEQDEGLASSNHLQALKHVVDTDLDKFGFMYQQWLLETQVSHPTFLSASPYYAYEQRTGFDFYQQPIGQDPVSMTACGALLAAVCQWPVVSAHGWPLKVPAGGQ
ncbi:hypothetical protein V1638_17070 [Pseudarthrobacter sp. J64]|uniref:hypothetical protein n=1 Tax=Pseudarthrobacter sp. J64 TaxID=3116485 RepID=UPI002E7FE6B5|nr:hypothetical protein [Pseudarthrobacter sp. J64]MEE2571085.1 hypothetical protein [Pseudarthrobacter sp. J64]